MMLRQCRVSLQRAARLTGLSEQTLHRAILLGELHAVRADDERHYLIRLEDLDPYRSGGRAPSAAWCLFVIPFTLFPLVVFLGSFQCALVLSALQTVWDKLDTWQAVVVALMPPVNLLAAFLEIGVVGLMLHRLRFRI